MNTKRIAPQQLGSLERMMIAYSCKKYPAFEIVRHDNNTIYINGSNPAAERMETIIADLMQFDLLDVPNAAGLTADDLLNEFEAVTNPDAAYMLLRIWHDEREKQRKAAAEAKAVAWYAANNELPEDLPGYDLDLLRALYFKTKDTEYNTPMQKTDREHSFNAAMKALFYYGYLAGKEAAEQEATA